MIVAAAIQYGPLIMSRPAPCRHHDVLQSVMGMLIYQDERDDINSNAVQGFLNDKGEFLDRRAAYMHVLGCGQGLPRREYLRKNYPERNFYDGDELFSEDLW